MQHADKADTVIPYRAWWGLAGCALFMGLIMAAGPYSAGVNIGPDLGDFWYYWQRSDATVWSRLSAWLPYCAHQLSIWWLIAHARQARPNGPNTVLSSHLLPPTRNANSLKHNPSAFLYAWRSLETAS